MRCVTAAVILTASIVTAGTAAAQSRDDNWARCIRSDPDLRIDACTAIIQSGQETTKDLTAAFLNRGYAYNGKREYDRAIQDFDQAIRLDPNDALAFHNRGYAYYGKREYDRAIQDYDQAIRLNPNDAQVEPGQRRPPTRRGGHAYDALPLKGPDCPRQAMGRR